MKPRFLAFGSRFLRGAFTDHLTPSIGCGRLVGCHTLQKNNGSPKWTSNAARAASQSTQVWHRDRLRRLAQVRVRDASLVHLRQAAEQARLDNSEAIPNPNLNPINLNPSLTLTLTHP